MTNEDGEIVEIEKIIEIDLTSGRVMIKSEALVACKRLSSRVAGSRRGSEIIFGAISIFLHPNSNIYGVGCSLTYCSDEKGLTKVSQGVQADRG